MRKLQALSVFNCDAINQMQRANRAAGQRPTELDLSRETVVDETNEEEDEESEESEEEEEEEAEEEENAGAEATRRTNDSFQTPNSTAAGPSTANDNNTSDQDDGRDPLTKAAEVAAASGVQAGNGRPRRSEAARARPQRYGFEDQVQVQQPKNTKSKSKSKK